MSRTLGASSPPRYRAPLTPVVAVPRAQGLWRYNAITGYWVLVRTSNASDAPAWLAIFRKDEPDAHFQLATRKPIRVPV